MKLLRPLHRQRTRRRSTARVLDQSELAERFGVELADLKEHLEHQGVRYHMDGQSRLWASIRDDE